MRSGREQHGGQPGRGSPRRPRRAEATREAGKPPSADVGLSPARRLAEGRRTGTFKPDAAAGSRSATGEPARGSPRERVTSELIKGHAEDAVVCSCPEEAVHCACLGLAGLVSAWPGSPCGTGAKKDRRSSGWLWTGATVTEAREHPSDQSLGRGTELRRRKKRLNWQILPAAPRVTAAGTFPWPFSSISLGRCSRPGVPRRCVSPKESPSQAGTVSLEREKLYRPSKRDAEEQQRKGCGCRGGSVSVPSGYGTTSSCSLVGFSPCSGAVRKRRDVSQRQQECVLLRVALLGPGDAQSIAPPQPRFGCRPLRMPAVRGRACVWRLLALCAVGALQLGQRGLPEVGSRACALPSAGNGKEIRRWLRGGAAALVAASRLRKRRCRPAGAGYAKRATPAPVPPLGERCRACARRCCRLADETRYRSPALARRRRPLRPR
ncbi:uncharacterized protein FYN16_001673 [Cariama cristata]